MFGGNFPPKRCLDKTLALLPTHWAYYILSPTKTWWLTFSTTPSYCKFSDNVKAMLFVSRRRGTFYNASREEQLILKHKLTLLRPSLRRSMHRHYAAHIMPWIKLVFRLIYADVDKSISLCIDCWGCLLLSCFGRCLLQLLKMSKMMRCAPHVLPPCRVCGLQAKGFHYGVNTCDACKVIMDRCHNNYARSVWQ